MKAASSALLDACSTPTTQAPIIRVDLYDETGSALLGALNWSEIVSTRSDGDLAGPASITVSDPGRMSRPGRIVRVLGGYAGTELLAFYRGRITDIEEDPGEPDALRITCGEGLLDLLRRRFTTPRYSPSRSGHDGTHVGPWTRPEIAADLAAILGFGVASIPASSRTVEQPSYVLDSGADALAKVLLPERLKARIGEDGNLSMFPVRTSGLPDHFLSEGANLADIDSPKRAGEPLITEVLVEGGEGEEVQVAHPPAIIQEDAVSLPAGTSNLLHVIEIPQAKDTETLQFEVCVEEPISYSADTIGGLARGQGALNVFLDFRTPSGLHLWGAKDVLVNRMDSGGEPNSNLRTLARVFYSDGTNEILYQTSGSNGGVSNRSFSKPVMGFGLHVVSVSTRFQPREAVHGWDISFTRMTEREMVEAVILRTTGPSMGPLPPNLPAGSTIFSYFFEGTGPFEIISYGSKSAGVITSAKDDAATDEFSLGLRLSSSWEYDTIIAHIEVLGQLWSLAKPKVIAIRRRDEPLAAIFGNRSVEILNPSIVDESEAISLAELALEPLSSASGPSLQEWGFTITGRPFLEPGDLVRLTLSDPFLRARFGTEVDIYVREIQDRVVIDEEGAVFWSTRGMGPRKEQAGLALFRNLGTDFVKDRADAQAAYLRAFLKARILRVIPRPGTSSSVLPRTDSNLYDVEIIADPGVVLEGIPNAFPEAYLETDVVFLEFQNGERALPYIIGRANESIVSPGEETRDPGSGPTSPALTCLEILQGPNLPDATEGVAYSTFVSTGGGEDGSSWRWDILFGSLPAGLSMSPSASFNSFRQVTISGTPAIGTLGSWSFGPQVRDDLGNKAIRDLRIQVR